MQRCILKNWRNLMDKCQKLSENLERLKLRQFNADLDIYIEKILENKIILIKTPYVLG